MAGPESEHIYGIQLRESANDGSDFASADTDYRIAFLGEDGFLHVKDSAGAVSAPYDTSGAGKLAVIAETVVAGAAAASIDFTSIPGIYRHLQIVVQGRSNDAGTFAAVNLTFNADTGSNYDWHRITTTNAAVAAAASAGATSARVGIITAAGATASNNPGSLVLTIPNYAATVFNKTAQSAGVSFLTTAATGFNSETNYAVWRSTAAITRVTLTPSAGSWIIGSTATLYGLDN